ncbi:MAG: hypothetical protein ACSLFE_07105 [Gemmatimonadaceae bacterium]
MIRLRKLYTMVGAAALLVGSGCGDLEVTNPNNPDIVRALASPADVQNIAVSSVRSWYLSNTLPFGPGRLDDAGFEMVSSVTADMATGNYGNFGMRFNNLEPRIPYNNNSSGPDRWVTENPWNYNYAALGAANDALRALTTGGIVIPGTGNTEKYKHLAQFTQAATLMKVGLVFDQAFIIDETFDLSGALPVLQPYADVSAAALAKWEALATAAAGTSFTYDPAEFPIQGGFNSSRMARIANTMAAITMAATPRNATEAAAVNWAKVAQLADKGIGTGSAGAPFDFTIMGDGTDWWSYLLLYGNLRSWVRIDQRLIRLMEEPKTTDEKFNGTIKPAGTSPDARYTSDFLHVGGVIGDPGRGIYMQSPWFHKRYICCSWEAATPGLGPMPYVLAAESDLVRAEALIRSGGSKVTAAGLINNSRVGRGQMTPLTGAESDAVLLTAVDYERQVELLFTNGNDLFWARHGLTDRLQPGTWRHLPLPAKELETLGQQIYTFGGAAENPTGM